MPTPKINKKAPIFKGECTGNKNISLDQLKGKNVVLYFYPKDSTPGCTTEGQDFRDLKGQFTRTNTIIFGLSRESIKSHENFKEIVLNGLYEENGMKGFSDILNEKNVFEVHSYIVDVATKEREKNINN